MNDDHSKHVDHLEPFPPETWLDWCDGDLEQLAVDAIEELHRRGKANASLERWFAL